MSRPIVSAFTPGPWALSDSGDARGRGFIRASSIDAMRDDGSRPAVARVCTAGVGYSTFIANARLIGAAPELLAACEYVLRHHVNGAHSLGGDSADVLRHAIRKAGVAVPVPSSVGCDWCCGTESDHEAGCPQECR